MGFNPVNALLGGGLMGINLAPSMPKPIPPPVPPTMASGIVQQSMAAQAAAAAAAEGRGFAGTLETGPEGAPTPELAKQGLKPTLGG